MNEARDYDVAGRAVLITGASRGIGRSIASALARRGASVAVVARDETALRDLVNELRSGGADVLPLIGDVADEKSAHIWTSSMLARFGRIDALVNNAARQQPIGPLITNSFDDWAQTLTVNLLGPVRLIQAVVPVMARARRGSVINLAGGGATGPRPNFSAYAVSKAAIARLTDTIAPELAPFGIRCNAIAPGAINTRMLDEILAAGDAAGGGEMAAASLRKIRGGDLPEAAASLAVFLVSDASTGLTGKLISAKHDPWRDWAGRGAEISRSALYTIRRMDGHTIRPLLKELD